MVTSTTTPLPSPNLFWSKSGPTWTLFEGIRPTATDAAKPSLPVSTAQGANATPTSTLEPPLAVAILSRSDTLPPAQRFTALGSGWHWELVGPVRSLAVAREEGVSGLLLNIRSLRRAKTNIERHIKALRHPAPPSERQFWSIHPETPPDRPFRRITKGMYAGILQTEHGAPKVWVEHVTSKHWAAWVNRHLIFHGKPGYFPTSLRQALADVADHQRRNHEYAEIAAQRAAEQEESERRYAARRTVFDAKDAVRFLDQIIAHAFPPGWRFHLDQGDTWIAYGFVHETVCPIRNLGPTSRYDGGYMDVDPLIAIAMDAWPSACPDMFYSFEDSALHFAAMLFATWLRFDEPDVHPPTMWNGDFGYYIDCTVPGDGPRDLSTLSVTLHGAAAVPGSSQTDTIRTGDAIIPLPLPLVQDLRPQFAALQATARTAAAQSISASTIHPTTPDPEFMV